MIKDAETGLYIRPGTNDEWVVKGSQREYNHLEQGFDWASKRRLAFTDWNPVLSFRR